MKRREIHRYITLSWTITVQLWVFSFGTTQNVMWKMLKVRFNTQTHTHLQCERLLKIKIKKFLLFFDWLRYFHFLRENAIGHCHFTQFYRVYQCSQKYTFFRISSLQTLLYIRCNFYKFLLQRTKRKREREWSLKNVTFMLVVWWLFCEDRLWVRFLLEKNSILREVD